MELVTSAATATVKLAALSATAVGIGTAFRVASAGVAGFRIALAAATAHPIVAAVAAVGVAFGVVAKKIADAKAQAQGFMKEMKNVRIRAQFGDTSKTGGRVPGSLEARDWEITNSAAWQEGQAKIAAEQAGRVDAANRVVPFANTPSIDPMQGLNARLGLNKIDQKEPGGTLFQDVFNSAADAMKDKMKDVATAVDQYFGPVIEKTQKEIDAALKFAGEAQRRDVQAIATLDASNARQMFGGKSREEDLLDKIEQNTRPRRQEEGGIPGG
jgi:hypothetical protein